MSMKKRPIVLMAALVVVLAMTSGCPPRQPLDPNAPPPPPPTAEEIARSNQIKCNVATGISNSAKLAVAFTLKEGAKQSTKDIVAALLVGVDHTRDVYCNSVLSGEPIDQQMAAFDAFNAAVDELTERTLASSIGGGPVDPEPTPAPEPAFGDVLDPGAD